MTGTQSIAPFPWADYFETGFEDVDAQHHKLVDLINALAQRAASGAEITQAELKHVLDGLASYAAHHFATEEALMERAGLDARHVGAHRQSHADFVTQVQEMRDTADPARVVPTLHRFVTSWLTFHILDTDQSMARQLRAIADGVPAAVAFEEAFSQGRDPGNAALVGAVRTLLGLVAERNQELARLNASLEQRVAERTLALTDANRSLRQTLSTLQETRDRLLEADKMAAVGQLAAGVAHEINNPLGFVASNLGTLREYADRLVALVDTADRIAPDSPRADVWHVARKGSDLDFIRQDLPSLFDESSRGVERVSEIVRSLQELARPAPEEWVAQALTPLLDTAVREVVEGLQPGQEVIRSYDQLPSVAVNPALIAQVFRILLDNAARALSSAPGTITVRARALAPLLLVEIEDTGCGMDEATRARIFEPFFTTRPVGQGKGLGLSSAYRIVRQHGGRIEVSSILGKGSRFRVFLPIRVPG